MSTLEDSKAASSSTANPSMNEYRQYSFPISRQLACIWTVQQTWILIHGEGFTFLGAIGSLWVFDITFLTLLAMEPGSVVEAANAFPCVWLAYPGWLVWVYIPVTFTSNADAVGIVIAIVTQVAVGASIPSSASVTRWGLFTRFWKKETYNYNLRSSTKECSLYHLHVCSASHWFSVRF